VLVVDRDEADLLELVKKEYVVHVALVNRMCDVELDLEHDLKDGFDVEIDVDLDVEFVVDPVEDS